MKRKQLLKNDIVSLRAVEPEDLEKLYEWENDTFLWSKSDTVSPYSRFALKQYISESHRGIYELKQLRMMIELSDTDETIGMVDLYEFDIHNKKAGIGILVDELFQQKGYATQALELLVDYAFSFLSLNQVYAYIAVDNLSSQALFSRCGFTLSGVLKEWVTSPEGYTDVSLFQRINS